jgi:hypothetical protein
MVCRRMKKANGFNMLTGRRRQASQVIKQLCKLRKLLMYRLISNCKAALFYTTLYGMENTKITL